MLLGSIVSGLCLYGLGRQSNLWIFWICHALCGLVGWNLFGPLVVNSVLNKWFVLRRGWALALGSTGISLAGMVTPVVLTAWVDTAGWRAGYTSLAIFVLVVVIPVSLVMRRTPEDHGLFSGRARAGTRSRSGRPAGCVRSDACPGCAYTQLLDAGGRFRAQLDGADVHPGPRHSLRDG